MHDVTGSYVLLQRARKEAAGLEYLRRKHKIPDILLIQIIVVLIFSWLCFVDGGVEGSKYDIYRDSSNGKYRYVLHWIPSTFIGAMATCQSRGQGQGVLTPMSTDEEVELVLTLLSIGSCLRIDWTDKFFFIGLTTLGNQRSLGFLDRPRPGSSTDLLRAVSNLDELFANSSSQANVGPPPSSSGSSVLSNIPVKPLCAAIRLPQVVPSTQDSAADAAPNSMCSNNSDVHVSYPLEVHFHDCDGGVPDEDGLSSSAEHAFVCRIPMPTPPPMQASMPAPQSPSSPQERMPSANEQHPDGFTGSEATLPPGGDGGVSPAAKSQTSEPGGGYFPSSGASSTDPSVAAAHRQARVLGSEGHYSRFLQESRPSTSAGQPPSRTPSLPTPPPPMPVPSVAEGTPRMPSPPSLPSLRPPLPPLPPPTPPVSSSQVRMARPPSGPAPKQAAQVKTPPPPSGGSVASPQPPLGTSPLSNQTTTGLSAASVMTRCDSEVINHDGVATRYLACHVTASWSESAQLCAELLVGGTLASFESQAQMDKVSNAFSLKDLGGMYEFWFGLASGAVLEQLSNENGLLPLEYVLSDPRVAPVFPAHLWISGGLRLHSSCRANPVKPPLPPEPPALPVPPAPSSPPQQASPPPGLSLPAMPFPSPPAPPTPPPSTPARSLPTAVSGSPPALPRASGCCGSLTILPLSGAAAVEGSSGGGRALLRVCYHRIKFICQAPGDSQRGGTVPSASGPSASGGAGASTLLSSLFLDAQESTYRGAYRVFRAQLELRLVGASYDALLADDGATTVEGFRSEMARQLSLSTLLPAWSFEVLQLRNGSIVAAINLTVRGLPRATLANFTRFVSSSLLDRQPLALFSNEFVDSWNIQESLFSVLGLWELSGPPESPPVPDPSSNRLMIVIVVVTTGSVLAGAAVGLLLALRRCRKLRRGTPVYLASLDNDELLRQKTLTSISPPPSLQQPLPRPPLLEVPTVASPPSDPLLLGRATANPLLSPLHSSSSLRLAGLSAAGQYLQRDNTSPPQFSLSGRFVEGWEARLSARSRDGSEAGARTPGGGGAAAAFSGMSDLTGRASGRLALTPSLSASRTDMSRVGTRSSFQGRGVRPIVAEALEPSGLISTGVTAAAPSTTMGPAVSSASGSLYDSLADLNSPTANKRTAPVWS